MLALLFLICALLSIVLLSFLISFLYVVPKHLEDIARLARKIYLQIEDDDDDDSCHPADSMTDRINNCKTLK